jgi:hypothetical protein
VDAAEFFASDSGSLLPPLPMLVIVATTAHATLPANSTYALTSTSPRQAKFLKARYH